MTIESHTATYKQLYVQSHTIRQVTNCTIECNYPVITDFDNMAAALHSSDSLSHSLNLSRKPLTCWLLYNDH